MVSITNRLKAAWSAFLHADRLPSYAVIYDVCDGDPEAGAIVSEEFYESFGSPALAAAMFRSAFPIKPIDENGINIANARLVLILGEIDHYEPSRSADEGKLSAEAAYFPLHC